MSAVKSGQDEGNLLETDGDPAATDVENGDGTSETLDSDGGASKTDKKDGETGDDESHSSGRTAAYIKSLKREKRRAEREAEDAKRQLAELNRQRNVKPEPKRADFDDDEAYIDAKVTWKSTQTRDTGGADEGQGLGQYAQILVSNGFSRTDATAIDESFAEATKVHKDFHTKVTTAKGLTKEVFEGLIEVDDPGKVLYWLASNQDELTKVANSGDAKAIAVRLGRIEERIELGESKDKTSRRTSNAPDPIEPLDAGRDESSQDLSDRLTDDEYFARANKALLKQRGMSR